MPFVHYQVSLPLITPATGGTIEIINVNSVPTAVHTFTSSGTFTTVSPIAAVGYLIVGGGGGGGGGGSPSSNVYYNGGGGGAGGYVETGSTSPSLPASTAYSIVVGSGGTGGDGVSVAPTSGTSSSAFGFTALGGGHGGQLITGTSPATGGSGGGGSGGGTYPWQSRTQQNGAAGIQNSTYGYGRGFAGAIGKTIIGDISIGGGGGGANGSPTEANNGGFGRPNSITGTSIVYARGGAGSFSAFQPEDNNVAGSAPNTFGGGGGGGTARLVSVYGTGRISGTNGNPGIVIIRYPLVIV